MSKTFCALPWKHMLITAYGGAQTCCLARGMIRDQGSDVSLYTKSVEETFNAESQRKVRLNMLEGKESYECQLCYDNERGGLNSERIAQNSYWEDLEGFTFEDAVEATREDGSTTIERPAYYQMLVSNVCNLACRMCNGEASSKIENDPVHRAWAPGYNNFDMPEWQDNQVTVGPAPMLGISSKGFIKRQYNDVATYYMRDTAELQIPVMSETNPFVGCEIDLKGIPEEDIKLRVFMEEKVILETVLASGDSVQTVMFSAGLVTGKDLNFKMEIQHSGDVKDLEVGQIKLLRHGKSERKKEHAVTRFTDKTKSLFDQDSFLFHDILGRADTLRRIYVTGGEPFYAKPLLRMLNYLEDTGESAHVHANFTTNATVVSDALLKQLHKFERVNIGLSLDGVGAVQEYIRHPSNWAEIETNIGRFMEVEGIAIHAIPAVQSQNVLYLADLLRFCDERDLHYGLNLVYYPNYLNVLTMPRAARDLAATRLQAYVDEDCPSDVKKNVVTPIIGHLRSEEDQFSFETLREFMLFTNDLDRSRGQSFAATFPELVQFYADTGFKWTDETRYLGKKRA